MKHTDKFVTQERADQKYCIDCIYFKLDSTLPNNYKLGFCNYYLSKIDGSPKYAVNFMRENKCFGGKYWETNKEIREDAEKENQKELQKRKDQVDEWKNIFPKNKIVDEAPYLKIKETLVWLKNKLCKRN